MGNLVLPSSAVSYASAVNCTVTIVDQPAAGSITPGNSDTFEIQVTPIAPGPFSVSISVDSDDPDEDPYTYTVSGTCPIPGLKITPDLGLPIEQQFDPLQNPHLVRIPSTDFIDVAGELVEVTYKSARKLRFMADIGSGNQAYEMPANVMDGKSILRRRYLWRIDAGPDTIGVFRMVQ